MNNSVQIIETAYAKVNLALHVRSRRRDGYHDIETVFAFCEDGDRIIVAPADRLTLTIDGPFTHDLSTTDNLVVRAARALDPERGAAIHLTKNLPVASGIGGGSADAAATLRALSRLWDVPLPGASAFAALGADVPACLASRTMRGEGVGEQLIRAQSVAGTPVLLVNPRLPLSTASVFKVWDGVDRGPLGDWRDGRNDLETPARELVPQIGSVIDWLLRRHDVTLARMSGSGATCFALFGSMASRDRAVAEAARELPGYWTMESVLR